MIGIDAPHCQVIFPEKTDSSEWVLVAPQLNSQAISKLVQANGKLYGVTAGGRLFEWNGTDAWVQKAPQLDSQTIYLNSACVLNNKIYAGTQGGGRLFEWNDVDAWVQKAPQYASETDISSLAVFNSKIYAGTGINGNLLEWNDVDAWVQKAPQFSSNVYIMSLTEFNDKLYGTTFSSTVTLLEWNGTDAWVQKASSVTGLTGSYSSFVFNGKLYNGTATEARLFEWNDVDAWVQKAPQYASEASINSLIEIEDEMYAGTANSGFLLKWNGVDDWTLVSSITPVSRLQSVIVFNGQVYGGTNDGQLLMFIDPSMLQPSKINISREEAANAQRCTISLPNVNPDDKTDAGYYSPYRTGTDFPGKTENEWKYQIIPSKSVKVKAGYGDNLVTVFTGTIDDVSHDIEAYNSLLDLDCRDGGSKIVDKTISAVIDGITEYYIDYPIDSATTASWLTSDMFVVMTKGDKMVFTSDLGGPVTLTLTAATYTGATLATHLASVMNANTTLTGTGTITFSVSYNSSTHEFTISASGAHTIAFTLSQSTAAVLFGMTDNVIAANSIVSVEPYTATIETIVKDLCVRAGFAAANITIEPTYQLLDTTFERMSYGDAIEQMCTLSGFEFIIDEDDKPIFRYPTDRQPEATDEVVVLTGTTAVSLAKYPIVTASILVYSGLLKTGTLYSSSTDYTIVAGTSSTAWTIARTAGSTIPSGDTVYVTYVYAAWVFKEGEDIFKLNLKISQRDLYGKIIVEGDDCSGSYTTTSPRWDTSTIPADKVLFVLDENLDTDAKCQAIADRLATDMLAHYVECEWAAVAIPWLQVGDCVQIIESSSTISEIYRITNIDYDFDSEGFIMTFKAYHYGYTPI